jgi:hypothetical protein
VGAPGMGGVRRGHRGGSDPSPRFGEPGVGWLNPSPERAHTPRACDGVEIRR